MNRKLHKDFFWAFVDPDNQLSKLVDHASFCDVYTSNLFEYESQKQVFIFWGEDLPDEACRALYYGVVDEKFIGRLCEFAYEMQAVFDLRENSLRFAEVGTTLSFSSRCDEYDERYTICYLHDRGKKRSWDYRMNLENHVLLMEWLDEQECIIKMAELALELQRLGIAYDRKHSEKKTNGEASPLGRQSDFFYIVWYQMDNASSHPCHLDRKGVATIQRIIDLETEKVKHPQSNAM